MFTKKYIRIVIEIIYFSYLCELTIIFFSFALLVPICLPRAGEDFTGRIATVTGWGRLKYGGGVPSVLQEVQVPIMENHVCQEMFRTAGHNKLILNSFLCAGYANGQKDSCEVSFKFFQDNEKVN